MRLVVRKMLSVWVVAILLCVEVVGAAPTIDEILNRYRQTKAAYETRLVESRSITSYTDSKRGETVWRGVRMRFCTDGNRTDSLMIRWLNLDSEAAVRSAMESSKWETLEPPNRKHGPFRSRIIWDGDTYFTHKIRRDLNMARLEISKDEEHKDHHLAVGYQAPARGYFSSDLEPVSAILGVAEDVRLRNRKEKIRGVECYVVEANTGNGDYTVWFDPEHGYNIRRAEVHKRGDDTWYGKPLSRPPAKRTEFTFELENVECQEIGGHWIPVRAEWETTTKYESGRRQAAKHIYELDNLDTSPDFEDIGAFVPDVRNGTRTIIEGENPAIPLYWQDGEARPKVPGGLQNE